MSSFFLETSSLELETLNLNALAMGAFSGWESTKIHEGSSEL